MLCFWWGVVAFTVWRVDPAMVADIPTKESYLIPAVLVWMTLWYTLSLVVGDKKRGAVVASGILVYLYLRLWGVDIWWNVGLLAVIFGLIYRLVVIKFKKPDPPDPPAGGQG